ncbi:MAG: DUF4245 domain-containing protein [Micrococcales bacterium]
MANDIDESKLSAEERAKRRRARQTLNNLLLSLAACAGLVLALILIVPRDDSSRLQPADYVAIGADAAASSGQPVLIPELIDDSWYASAARWTGTAKDGVASWYVGFVGKNGQYLGLTQAFDSNQTWLALFLKESIQNGSTQVDGITWDIYQAVTKNDPPKSRDFAMVAEIDGDQVIVYGTAPEAEFNSFVALVSKDIHAKYQK